MGDTQDVPLSRRFAEVGPACAQYWVRMDGTVAVIEMSGELDLSNADTFEQCLSVFRAGDSVVIEMGRLTFIDSTGIGVLVRVRARGVEVACRGVQPAVRRALEICGLKDTFAFES